MTGVTQDDYSTHSNNISDWHIKIKSLSLCSQSLYNAFISSPCKVFTDFADLQTFLSMEMYNPTSCKSQGFRNLVWFLKCGCGLSRLTQVWQIAGDRATVLGGIAGCPGSSRGLCVCRLLGQTGKASAKRDRPAELRVDVIIFKKKPSGDITGLTLLAEAS